MIMDCNNKIVCTCSFSCGRHGECWGCVAYHIKNNNFPACFFTPAAERTGDRSLSALIKDRGK